MQTFLPYQDFELSAKCLDNSRLGKQRVEAYQILQALLLGGAWARHPATKMWRGFDLALCVYALACVREWQLRGYKDTLACKFEYHLNNAEFIEFPNWLGGQIHVTHQSNLVRKNPNYYTEKFNPLPPADLQYIWPTSKYVSLSLKTS